MNTLRKTAFKASLAMLVLTAMSGASSWSILQVGLETRSVIGAQLVRW